MSPRPEPLVRAFVAAAPDVDAAARSAILRRVEPAADAPGRVLLATCHRVEMLTGAAAEDPVEADGWPAAVGPRSLSGVEAARHVIALAVGLESTVVGEDQVLHQLRTAVTEARARGSLGPDLGPLIDAALRAGRLGRSWRPVEAGRAQRSLADLAADRVAAVLGSLDGRSVLVVGTGEMGRASVVALHSAGAIVQLASRTHDHAVALAAERGVRPVAFDPGAVLDAVDAVIVALGGPWSLSAAGRSRLETRPVVVDLSMPSALSSDTIDRLGERLIDIDRLAVGTPPGRAGVRYRSRLQALVDRTLDGYLAGLDARRTSAADRLAARIEHQRSAGLAAYLRQRPDLDPEVRDELDALTRDLSARLFREPLARLARDPDGRRRRALDELFGT